MILKVFKEKSNKKYLNKLLTNRHVNVTNGKVESLGVIVNNDEFTDLEQFEKLKSLLSLKDYSVKIITYTSKKESNTLVLNENCYNAKDFGYRGKLKKEALKSFIEEPFDVLISYYTHDILELKLLTASSKAKLKIGLLQTDERINDLIIKTPITAFNIFKNEVFKYLTILNKIKHEQ